MPQKISSLDKAISIGLRDRDVFDWPNAQGAFEKLKEEILELEEVLFQNEISTKNPEPSSAKVYEEFSDVFFTLLQVARHLKIDPNKNLAFAIKKYSLRYDKMSSLIKDRKLKKEDLSLKQLELFWQQAKKETQGDLKSLLERSLQR